MDPSGRSVLVHQNEVGRGERASHQIHGHADEVAAAEHRAEPVVW